VAKEGNGEFTHTVARKHFEKKHHPAVVYMPCGIKSKYKRRFIAKLPDGTRNYAEYKRVCRSEKKLPKKLAMEN
jgi:hypothetical protein